MSAFRAMGTDVRVVTPGLGPTREAAVTRRVAAVFDESERRFSRFLPESELARLNRATGPTPVSAPMLAALDRARAYVDLTRGLFDPTIGSSLDAAGYDRSFAPGALDRPTRPPPGAPAGFDQVVVDAAAGTVSRPPGVRLDLGGFIKGHTADRAARLLPEVAAVDAGGDAVLRGAGPDGDGWLVDVEDPADAARVVLTLRVRDAAVATSAPNRRRWLVAGAEQHHLIDPRTGLAGASDLAQVTVIARTAELADVLAKTAFFLGATAGRRFLERLPAVAGVLVRHAGSVEVVGDVDVVDE